MKTATVEIEQIKNVINKNSNFLRDNYNVQAIGVFGSVAREESTKNSDVDVLVEFSEAISFFKFIELEEFLSKALGRKVDLVTKKALKSPIKEEVLKETVYV
jgi:hypothetical protein